MALIIDGVTIPTSGNNLSYNGTQLTEVKYDGVSVWKKNLFGESAKEYGYTGGMQSCLCPAGLYKFEVWGSCGSVNGGYGGYACRYYAILNDTSIYICVGGIPYNGGGYGEFNTIGTCYGGGCTHIATTNRGELRNYSGYKSEVLIVAGGGGSGITRWGASSGGSGGGLTGGSASGGGGSQTAGGYSNQGDYGSFGLGGTARGEGYHGCGGGGGWYGGGAGAQFNSICSAGGGSGYIGSSTTIYNGIEYTNSTVNGQRSTTGYARITFVA